MNEESLFFWLMGILFGLVMLFAKSPLGWKYFHSIIFLSYFVNAYWEMNGEHHFGYMSDIIAAFTVLHIIIFLVGMLIFGFFRRQNEKSESLSNLYQTSSEQNSEPEN